MAKIALLIGVSEYSEGLLPIPSAIKDVEAMRRVLEHPDMGAFDEVTVLSNPDKGSIEKAVEDLFSNRQRDDLVLLYFSGHGIKDQSARFYLSTKETGQDQKGDFRRSTALAASKLQEYITDSRSKREVIILDCCFSGAFVQGKGTPAMGEIGEIDIQTALGGRGRAILTSSSSIEYSFESEDNDLSIYTRYLVEGIETGAADKDGDQLISVNELHEYASERVQEAAPAMTPKFYLSLEQEDTIYLAKSPLAANDPKFKYRKIVEDIIRNWDDEDIKDYLFKNEDFSARDRAVLDARIYQLNLSSDEARAIEIEVLSPLQQRLENLKKYENAFRRISANHTSLTSKDRESLKELQGIYGLRDEDVQFIEDEDRGTSEIPDVQFIEDRGTSEDSSVDLPMPPTSSTSPIDLNSIIAKLLYFINTLIPNRNFLIGIGIASIVALSLLVVYRSNPSIPKILSTSSQCSKKTGDFISEGEDILNYSQPSAKIQGADYYAQCDYKKALSRFKDAWQSDRLDPETLIYLNNALLEAKQAKYYTIAVAVSIPPNEGASVGDIRAKEMLRGVAQLQTEINLGLFDVDDSFVKDFLGQGILNGKAINGKGLKVIITNDENNKSKAKQRAEALSKLPEILGVVGHYSSEMTVATVDIYGKENLVLISPGSTTNELTKYPRKNFLRTGFSVEQQSPAIAKFLQEKSIKKAVSFYSEGSPFSDSFHESFKNIFKQSPFYGTVAKVTEFNLGKPNFDEKKAIQELRRKEELMGTTIGLVLFPDAVGNAQNNAIKLIKLNDGQNWIIGSWGLRSPNTLKQVDNLQPFQKFVIPVPWESSTSPNQDFFKDVKNLWGTTSVNAVTALSYDATLALKNALEKEKNPTPINVLKQLRSPDFRVDGGATGTIEFNPENGDRKNLSVEFVHIVECQTDNLDFTFVPIKYSTAKDAGLTCLN
jgi:branched-chain amino acid transport system substrate-binding protein